MLSIPSQLSHWSWYNIIIILEIVIVQQLLCYLSYPISTLVVLEVANGSRVFALWHVSKFFLILAFLIVTFSQTTLYSDMEGCQWLTNMGKVVRCCLFIRSAEDENPLWIRVEQHIISAMYGSSFFKQAINGFHGSFYFTVTSEDSVDCLLLEWNHVWLQIACIHGMNMRSIVGYNFLKYPYLAKSDFVWEIISEEDYPFNLLIPIYQE